MGIELGQVTLEDQQLLRHFRIDLRDDWFPDPKYFADMLEGGLARTVLTDNFSRNHGQYKPLARDIFNLPKPNFTIRCALETGLPDRLLYQGLVSYLAPFYEHLIPWNVFNHRLELSKSPDRYFLRRGVACWKDFTGAITSAMSPEVYLLSTDLSNYYEYIDLPKLKHILVSLIEQLPAIQSKKRQFGPT